MDKPPKEDDGTVSWKCEECAPKYANCDSEPLRSDCISQATEAKHKRMKLQETPPVRKEKSVNLPIDGHAHAHTDRSSQEKSSDYLQKNHTVGGIEDLPIKKRWLVLEDEKFESVDCPLNMPSDQALEVGKFVCSGPINVTVHQSEPTKVDLPNLNVTHDDPRKMSIHLQYPVPNKYIQAEPIIDPVWRFDTWPQGFQTSPLTDECIALYFFPQCERDGKDFDDVLGIVIEQDLALKTVVNNVDLLIFSSRVLPPEHWRICQRYYLWGVFRAKRNKSPLSRSSSLASDEVAVSNQHPYKS